MHSSPTNDRVCCMTPSGSLWMGKPFSQSDSIDSAFGASANSVIFRKFAMGVSIARRKVCLQGAASSLTQIKKRTTSSKIRMRTNGSSSENRPKRIMVKEAEGGGGEGRRAHRLTCPGRPRFCVTDRGEARRGQPDRDQRVEGKRDF